MGRILQLLSAARLPPDRIPEQFISGPPDLAVEILSPGDRWSEVEEKVADYLAAGARRVWLVDPRADADILEGEDVVPGFALPLAELFGPLA